MTRNSPKLAKLRIAQHLHQLGNFLEAMELKAQLESPRESPGEFLKKTYYESGQGAAAQAVH